MSSSASWVEWVQVMSVLALFFYTTICKLLTWVPLSASQTSCLFRMFVPGDCQTSRSSLDICSRINIAQSPNAGHKPARFSLLKAMKGLAMPHASVERQWRNSGETLTSSSPRLLKSNLHPSKFWNLISKPKELQSLQKTVKWSEW